MVQSAGKPLIAAGEKGAAMHWREAGAHTVAAVRVLLRNDQWRDAALAA